MRNDLREYDKGFVTGALATRGNFSKYNNKYTITLYSNEKEHLYIIQNYFDAGKVSKNKGSYVYTLQGKALAASRPKLEKLLIKDYLCPRFEKWYKDYEKYLLDRIFS